MSLIPPTPLSFVLDGKTTPRKKLTTPKTPSAPKKSKLTGKVRNLFAIDKKPKKKNSKKKSVRLPKTVFIVCDQRTKKPLSVHATRHGADVFYWKKVYENGDVEIVECSSGKD